MKYDFEKDSEIKRFDLRVKTLKEKRALVEFTDKSKRTLSQNNYSHLLFAAYAIEYGCTMDYAKQVVLKEEVCPDVFMYKKQSKFGDTINEKRSTADIPKELMAKCISRFKEYAGINGIHLPDAENEEERRSLEVMIERMSDYL